MLDELLFDSIDVSIIVDRTPYLLQNVSNGIYLGVNVPEIVGEKYTLFFINPINNRPVRASSTLMPYVGFDSLNVFVQETQFDTLINVDIWIDDPMQKNWYMVNVQTFNEEYDILNGPYTILLEDAEFNGELYYENFTVPFLDYIKGDSVVVSMANINEEYYQFLKLRKDQNFSLLEGFGEPINYPTNVQNGLGFFHLHQPDIRLFLMDE